MGKKLTYACIECGTVVTKDNTAGKYCSNKCRGIHQVKITHEEISKGLTENRDPGTLLRFLKEQHGENCFECGIGAEWNGKKLSLQLDHIDGNSDNNSLKNLRILCPNCHTQTETYGSKGHGSRYRKSAKRNNYLRNYKAQLV